MKARVYVAMKKTVLDPQGQAICTALNRHGHTSISEVRQGKYYEIEIDGATDAQAELDEIAREVLSNPVIEDYRVELIA